MSVAIGRSRPCYLSPPQLHTLRSAIAPIDEAFGGYGSYLVGSVLTRPDYRDVDVRLILDDGRFMTLFGFDLNQHHGHATALWTSLAVTYSRDLSRQTGLNVDFQIQAMTQANKDEPGERQALMVPRALEPEFERELDEHDEVLVEHAWQRHVAESRVTL